MISKKLTIYHLHNGNHYNDGYHLGMWLAHNDSRHTIYETRCIACHNSYSYFYKSGGKLHSTYQKLEQDLKVNQIL